MGWSCGPRSRGISTRDYLAPCLSPNEIVACASFAGETYMAVRNPTGYVFGLVVLTRYSKGEFCYKFVDETMGPYQTQCPERILDLLSDPPTNEHAKQWREECRKAAVVAARAKSLVRGDVVGFSVRLRFGDVTKDRLTFERARRGMAYFSDEGGPVVYKVNLRMLARVLAKVNDEQVSQA